jgi:hypothetical protein
MVSTRRSPEKTLLLASPLAVGVICLARGSSGRVLSEGSVAYCLDWIGIYVYVRRYLCLDKWPIAHTSLMNGILVAGHDGSYQAALATDICAGAAVLYCTCTKQYAQLI